MSEAKDVFEHVKREIYSTIEEIRKQSESMAQYLMDNIIFDEKDFTFKYIGDDFTFKYIGDDRIQMTRIKND